MKKIISLIVLLTMVGAASAAIISSDESGNFAIPGAAGSGARDIFAKWALAKRSVSETAAAKVAQAGAVVLDGVCATTLTNEVAYVAIYNQSSTSGITATATGKDLLVRVLAKNLAAPVETGKRDSCEFFPVPIPADTGLVFINSTANMASSLIYRVIRR